MPLSIDPKIARRARNRRYREKRGNQLRPFIGVDGEGGGADALGRQHFLLLRAGDMELFNDNERLTTDDCLEFLLSTPDEAILVGYFFTYDATQILRDIPSERIARMFEQRDLGPGRSPYTFWKRYGIDFKPRQYLRVCRIDEKCRSIEGTARTINEVGGFFQKSFVEALKDWKIGDDATVAMIAAQKERRDQFDKLSQIERDYCGAECTMLAELMTKFRETCRDADIAPRAWRGAGWISARLHEKHGTPKQQDRDRKRVLDTAAMRAYYGGRFEVTKIGRIPGPIYEYDINSAYPDAMRMLPCPIHTRWYKQADLPPKGNETYVANIHYRHPIDQPLCGFPYRHKGRLLWPIEGSGWYWKPEIEAAQLAGAQIVEWRGGYAAKRMCDCRPFDWVAELYAYRKSIGKAAQGYPIKLGINGLYGKLAQRQGAAPWRDHILAGLITAHTRAKLIRAYAGDPDAIVMLATDGLFSTRPLPVNIGDELGQWEFKLRETGMFVVQPGIYWSPGSEDKPKTRGIPRSAIIEHRDLFEDRWDHWCAGDGGDGYPSVTVRFRKDGSTLKTFVGHRLALARGKPELAGCWIPNPKEISFDWSIKRRPDGAAYHGMIVTRPYLGGADAVSEAYDPLLLTDVDNQNVENEAQPDYEPWGNSGE